MEGCPVNAFIYGFTYTNAKAHRSHEQKDHDSNKRGPKYGIDRGRFSPIPRHNVTRFADFRHGKWIPLCELAGRNKPVEALKDSDF